MVRTWSSSPAPPTRRNQIRLSSKRPTRSPSTVRAEDRPRRRAPRRPVRRSADAVRQGGRPADRPDRPRFRRRHGASLLRRISRPAAGFVLRRADTTRKSGDLPGPTVTVTLWRAVPLRRAGGAARRRAVAPTVVPVNRRRRPPGAGPASHRAARPSPAVYVGRAVGALWMGLAHGVGWAVRAAGRQAATARDLDPEHRRDGAGLLLLGLALLTAVALWFVRGGPGRRAAGRHDPAVPRRDRRGAAGAAADRRRAG